MPMTVAVAPTPDKTGVYRNVTVEQAQQIVPFPVIVPKTIPPGIKDSGILVEVFPPIETAEKIYRVVMIFALEGDEPQGQAIHYTQISRAPINPVGGSVAGEERMVIEIEGMPINKARRSNSVIYWWQGEAYRSVTADLKGRLTESLAEQFVAELLKAKSSR
jgi:hypothetical protein